MNIIQESNKKRKIDNNNFLSILPIGDDGGQLDIIRSNMVQIVVDSIKRQLLKIKLNNGNKMIINLTTRPAFRHDLVGVFLIYTGRSVNGSGGPHSASVPI